MDTSEYMPMFLAEAREHLQELNIAVVRLEENPEDRPTIDEIFRIAHSLKGMSATMGFAAIAELTHEMEEVFELLRQRTGGLASRRRRHRARVPRRAVGGGRRDRGRRRRRRSIRRRSSSACARSCARTPEQERLATASPDPHDHAAVGRRTKPARACSACTSRSTTRC